MGLSVAGEGRHTVERPHQPFVFRSVLDGRPRDVIITRMIMASLPRNS